MHSRSLLFCLAAAALACPTPPDDGAQTSAGTAAETGSTAGTSGPGPGDPTGATTAMTTGSTDPTTGAAATDTTDTTGAPTTGADGTGDGSSSSSGAAETGPAAVGFGEVYEQVILANGCNSGYCHGDGVGGLTLTDEATSYASLVEVTASAAACDQTTLVVPGAVEASILWYRVRPAAQDGGIACATKMPLGSMGLVDAQAQLVHDWIAGGALE